MNHIAASQQESPNSAAVTGPRDAPRATRSLMRFPHVVAFALAWCAILVVLALELPGERFDWFFSEEGPVEILSCGFWLLLAALFTAGAAATSLTEQSGDARTVYGPAPRPEAELGAEMVGQDRRSDLALLAWLSELDARRK